VISYSNYPFKQKCLNFILQVF